MCCCAQEVSQQEMVRALKVEQAKELTKLRQEFELASKELQVCPQLTRGMCMEPLSPAAGCRASP